MMKENIVVTPTNIPSNNPLAAITGLGKGSLSVTPTTALPSPAHSKTNIKPNPTLRYDLLINCLIIYNIIN